MANQLNNIAVLIDADNASSSHIRYILQKIDTLGRITCKNIYGDWSNPYIQRWREALLRYVIEPVQKFTYVTGKNTTDIGLVIDAMDLLYSGKYDGFCLISSDSDFTALALRIRKNHVKVFGFGKRSTVDAFAQACDGFYYVEDLLPELTKPIVVNMVTQPISISKPQPKPTSTPQPKNTTSLVTAWDEKKLKGDTKLLNSLRATIINHPNADAKGWITFGCLGSGLKTHYPNFNAKHYGYAKLSSLVKKISLFETKIVDSVLYVRYKKT